MNVTNGSKTILVAGGAGFLGSHLIDFLLQKGNRVIGVDSFETGSPKNLQHLENHPQFTLINHDIQYPFQGLEEIDQIYNLACPASPPQESIGNRKIQGYSDFTRQYISPSTTRNLLGPCEFIRTSCMLRRGKRVAESLCYAYREQFGVDIRIARIFNTYGPRMGAGDGRVVSSFISAALAGRNICITGDGTATRSFQFVTDCIEGLYILMNSDYREGPVNIGNDVETSIQVLAERIVDLVANSTGKKKVNIVYQPRLVDDPCARKPQITLAKAKLGWAPVVPLDVGLQETINWHMHQT
ncbi:UDP-glucuronic acid decarboxylase 1 [Penicillium chermesinum]|uniref:UDP-glucuronate decarboxylase n=1 Tax=Penicillium chermesinum TaxID=63820 RepID=A0A9W9NRF4_9EURO|nr:UDP-glucuronic acid decarboxylase 1 [Penicillium chermesinum]KAJ5223224.1 UDP-glucuronic acid decarboxylase 1 [Penicillium chermesinum]